MEHQPVPVWSFEALMFLLRLILLLVLIVGSYPALAKGKKASGGSAIEMSAATVDDLNADPTNSLDLDQARQYMLELINQNRASLGAGPLELDPVASKAAQFHADEMAKLQFNSHWHPDGMKPTERYNNVGGTDVVLENSAGCPPSLKGFTASAPSNPKFSKDEIKWIENLYFNEQPPHDGHRRNILRPEHSHVGIGIALMNVTTTQNGQAFSARIPISAQEFINKYGQYTITSKDLKRGGAYTFEGQMKPGYEADCLDIRREDLPKDIPLKELQGDAYSSPYRGGYSLPDEVVVDCYPDQRLAQTIDARLVVEGQKFHYEVNPSPEWKPGLYYFLLWAHGPDGKHIEVSLETARLIE
jgi:Cysteine-rich secretory protein family